MISTRYSPFLLYFKKVKLGEISKVSRGFVYFSGNFEPLDIFKDYVSFLAEYDTINDMRYDHSIHYKWELAITKLSQKFNQDIIMPENWYLVSGVNGKKYGMTIPKIDLDNWHISWKEQPFEYKE